MIFKNKVLRGLFSHSSCADTERVSVRESSKNAFTAISTGG